MKSTENQKTDRRVQRTRKQLYDALIELIEEKGYESITVQNIIDRANFGRSTFYAHFQDKDDLLLSGMNELVHRLTDGIEQNNGHADHSLLISATPLFEQAQAQFKLYKAIIGRRGIELISHEIQSHLATHIQEQFEHKPSLDVPADVVANYLAGALLNLLKWWLDNNMPYLPAEMGAMFEKMALEKQK
ncbi:MAG: TetR/AcrR family transcriptional regulator [Chloroflexota bacterium]